MTNDQPATKQDLKDLERDLKQFIVEREISSSVASKKKPKAATASSDSFDQWMYLSKFSTIPKTVRLPETIAFQLDFIAQELKTNSGKLLTEILEDVLPIFMTAATEDSDLVDIEIIHHYRRLKEASALRTVDAAELIEKIRLLSSNAES